MRRCALAMLAVVMLSGCSGSDDRSADLATDKNRQTADGSTASTDTGSDGTTTTGAPEVQDDAVLAYIEGVTGPAAADAQKALDASEPDSPAALYAKFRLEVARAGEAQRNATFTRQGGGYEVCNDDDTCTLLDGFTVNEAGQVVSYAVDGDALGDRILGPGEPVGTGSVSVTRTVAYINGDGTLAVVLDIRNGSQTPVSAYGFSSIHVGPNGRQSDSSYTTLSSDVAPGATATDLLLFELADFGGRVQYEIVDSSYNSTTLDVPV